MRSLLLSWILLAGIWVPGLLLVELPRFDLVTDRAEVLLGRPGGLASDHGGDAAEDGEGQRKHEHQAHAGAAK